MNASLKLAKPNAVDIDMLHATFHGSVVCNVYVGGTTTAACFAVSTTAVSRRYHVPKYPIRYIPGKFRRVAAAAAAAAAAATAGRSASTAALRAYYRWF